MPDLYGVAHGVDAGNGGLHPVVDHDAVPDPQFQARLLGQGGVRRDADGQNHHVGVKRGPVFQQYVYAAVPLREALHRIAQCQLHTVSAHLAVDKGRHIRVKGVHQLLRPLDDGDLHPQLPQVLRQFQPDEAAAGQHRGPGMFFLNIVFHAESALHRPQGEELLQPHAGETGPGWLRAGGENQFVIALLELPPRLQILDGDSFALRMNGGDLMTHPHIHPEAGEKALRRLERQGLRGLNGSADVIRQAAVGVGDIAGAFEDHDLRLLVQSAEPGRRRSASRYAADDDNFHVSVPPFCCRQPCRLYFFAPVQPLQDRMAAACRLSRGMPGRNLLCNEATTR